MKDVQCNELFGGIAFKNHSFSFFISTINADVLCKLKLTDKVNRISIKHNLI